MQSDQPWRDPLLPLGRVRGKVVCVGDSLTAAEGVDADKGFCALLDARSEEVAVVQQGRSGWSTTAYLRRIDEVLQSLPADADLILLQLGANDLRVHGHSEETVRQAASNVGRLVDRLRRRAPRAAVVLVAPPTMVVDRLSDRIREGGFGRDSPHWLRRLGCAYRHVARRKVCGLIDLYPVLSPTATLDGAHPNEQGHRQIAEAIWRALSG